MERTEADKPSSEDGSQLSRNRSFKTKQLVRSQAIRESQSPPRALTPSPAPSDDTDVTKNNVNNNVTKNNSNNNVTKNNIVNNVTKNSGNNNVANNVVNNEVDDVSSECHIDECGKDNYEDKKQTVEIQITGRSWEAEPVDQRHRARRWLHKHHSEPSRDLLSNSPRVCCVCGTCANCPHCRGRRRRHICTIKQDSGIACSDECPDCSDAENAGPDGYRKAASLEERIYYCRCPDRKEKPKNITLSRMDSDERFEPTGPELVAFIKETLNKNPRDRLTLLKIERELHALVSDSGRCIVRFPVMTSYGRMLVHRCAALFQLSHHLDQTNKTSVLVSKSGTSGGRIPCTSFQQWCVAAFPPSSPDTRAKSILKRDTNSLDEPGSGALSNSRSKSLEQRERDYERMKRRIFTEDSCTQDEQWPWLGAGPVKLLTPDTARKQLVKVQSLESGPTPSSGRGVVSKSHSFGGYGGHEQPHPRLLSRQGDLASSSWRLSPSSSGYKTLSLRSTDSVTPSPTGGASPEPCCAGAGAGAVVCCVTDMGCVPPGALLIQPQTGRPLTNPDGSLYHYDPANPPAMYDFNSYHDERVDQSNEKKRGKLEKQHSFIDQECECQLTEETRGKCCSCACPRNDSAHRNNDNATTDQQTQNIQSPTNARYEQTEIPTETDIYDKTNESAPEAVQYESAKTQPYVQADKTYETNYDKFEMNQGVYEAATNQRSPYEQVANQRQIDEVINARIGKFTNQDVPEFYTQQAYGLIRNDEVTSPQSQHGNHGYPPVEMGVQGMTQAKMAQAQMPDPHIRPVSLTNMSYPTTVHQGYTPYINQFRMEQSLQPVYHPGQMVPTTEDLKATSTPQQEPTFRIDPSYPYAALDFAAQCGAYVDPNTMRSYNLPYAQVDAPPGLSQYPLGNCVLPQQLQHYPYQDVQWQTQPMMPVQPKLMVPELYPVYPNMYQYNLLYPQVIPQPYPLCQPLYGVVEKPPSRSNSVASASTNVNIHTSIHANTAANVFANAHAETLVEAADNRAPSTHSIENIQSVNIRNSNEIAAKIQQIKEQMAQLHTRDPRNNNNNNNNHNNNNNFRRDDYRRRNNGHGILGSYPHPGRPQRPPHDETQLSSAARAIVNSIRNMQAKNNYPDRREFQYRVDRPEYRRRQERDGDRLERDNYERDRPRNIPFQYRPPHLLRQMSPGTWCRRSPGPVHPVMNHPRRPHPDARNGRR